MTKTDDVDIATPINFYTLKDVKKLQPKTHNPGFSAHHISVPFRSVVIGASGSGKTNFLCNAIRAFQNTFNHIYVFTKAREVLYDYLTEKIDKSMLTIMYDDLPSLANVQWYGQSLCIFDDMVNEKQQRSIQELYIRGRKIQGGVSLMYLSQSYFHIPKMIRLQCNYIFLIKLSCARDMRLMLTEYSLGATKDQMQNMYDYCRDGQLQSFMTIDLQANDEKNYRKNFQEFLNPHDF